MSVLHKDQLEAKLREENLLINSGVLRDEHPLDVSPQFDEFLEACRRGDLKRCQELISAGVNINARDAFDYTGLVLASLCGHYDLVQLLLDSGAMADRGTWVGERTVYNALTDRIRKLLLSYDYSKSSDPLQPWTSHLTSLLSRQTPKTSDIEVSAGSDAFQLHRFVISSRTPYFRRKLAEAPGTTTWKLSQSIPPEAFRFVLRYLYLGDLPREVVQPDSSSSEEEVFKGIDKLCKQLEVESLWEVLAGSNRRLARQRYQDEVLRGQQQLEASFRATVLKHKMVVDTTRVDEVKWPHGNAMFADCILRADEPQGPEGLGGGEDGKVDETRDDEPAPEPNGIPIGPLAMARRAQSRERRRPTKKSVLYPVHKAFLIRSPYFETMFSSRFLEAQESEHLHIIKVDCSPLVLEIILTFLYTEKSDCPLEAALELMYTSDMLLLEKLKVKAALTISTLGSESSNPAADKTRTGRQDSETEPINVFDVIRAAWDLKVQRLEDFAAKYLAQRLEDYIDEPEFKDLIEESAARLETREETDTIELLDDIRFYLSERFRLRFEDAGLEDMLDESGEINVTLAGEFSAAGGGVGGVANGGDAAHHDATGAGGAQGEPTKVEEKAGQPSAAIPEGEDRAGLRTLDGELAEDEFASDAVNYQILLNKIDKMLDELKLDA